MKLLDVSTKTHPAAFAMVSDEDFDRVSKWKWSAFKGRNVFYAARRSAGKMIRLHQEIMGDVGGKDIDHVDGNGLNNTRENLRACTHQENMWNVRKRRPGDSRYKGVSWSKPSLAWVTYIRVDGKRRNLGYFDSEEAAAMAYNVAAKEVQGAYCVLNEVCVSAEEMQRARRPVRRGALINSAKLTEESVLAIRAAKGLQREVAAQFGVSQKLISNIKRGVAWKHVAGAPA